MLKHFSKLNTLYLIILSLILFLVIGYSLEYVQIFDDFIYNLIGLNSFLTPLMYFISFLFNVSIAPILSVLAMGILVYYKKIREAVIFTILVSFGAIVDLFMKNVFVRERPLGGLLAATDGSFPSGHTFFALIFFLSVSLCFGDFFREKNKMKFYLACIFSALLVGFSRIYLKMHWFSDVLAGFALGIFSFSFILFFVKYFLERKN